MVHSNNAFYVTDWKMGNVLIIDDDQMMCKAMSGLLRREGHEVVSARTLQSGMHKASPEQTGLKMV